MGGIERATAAVELSGTELLLVQGLKERMSGLKLGRGHSATPVDWTRLLCGDRPLDSQTNEPLFKQVMVAVCVWELLKSVDLDFLNHLLEHRSDDDQAAMVDWFYEMGEGLNMDVLRAVDQYPRFLSTEQVRWSFSSQNIDIYDSFGEPGWGPSDGTVMSLGKPSYSPEILAGFPEELGWERIQRCLMIIESHDPNSYTFLTYEEVCAYALANGYHTDDSVSVGEAALFIDECLILQGEQTAYYHHVDAANRPYMLSENLSLPSSFPSIQGGSMNSPEQLDADLCDQVKSFLFVGLDDESSRNRELMKALKSVPAQDRNRRLRAVLDLFEDIDFQEFRAFLGRAKPEDEAQIASPDGIDGLAYAPLTFGEVERQGPLYSYPCRGEFLEEVMTRLVANPFIESSEDIMREFREIYQVLEGRLSCGYVREGGDFRPINVAFLFDNGHDIRLFDVWIRLNCVLGEGVFMENLGQLNNLSLSGVGDLLRKTDNLAHLLHRAGLLTEDLNEAYHAAWELLFPVVLQGHACFGPAVAFLGRSESRRDFLIDQFVNGLDERMFLVARIIGVSDEEVREFFEKEFALAPPVYSDPDRFVENQVSVKEGIARSHEGGSTEGLSAVLAEKLSSPDQLDSVVRGLRSSACDAYRHLFEGDPQWEAMEPLVLGFLDGALPEDASLLRTRFLELLVSSDLVPRHALERVFVPVPDPEERVQTTSTFDAIRFPTRMAKDLWQRWVLTRLFGDVLDENFVGE